jgi:hypothetical protein
MRDRLRLGAPSRRQFLIGAAATTLLAACGDDDDVATSSETSGASSSDPELSVVRFYGPYFLAGVASRVPFGLADTDGILPTDASPDEVAVSVEAPDGSVVAGDLTAVLRADGLPRGYYAFEFTPEEPGFYNFTVTTDAGDLLSQVQVAPADDPIFGKLVKPGDPMPRIETPTVQDARGVTPICTRDPICPLHDRTVAEVVGTAPLVLMVATPAFCQTSVCGPVLDIMLEQTGDFPGVTFLHADVYRNPEENQQPPVPEDFAPVTTELGLPFEPVLYTVGPDGIVRDRLDYIFDGSEINETVARLVG